MMKGCNYALLIPIIGFFVEHNRAGVLALEHSIIGKEKSMSTYSTSIDYTVLLDGWRGREISLTATSTFTFLIKG